MLFMSFNIRYDNPDDGPDAWPLRAAAVADLIQRRRPDVFGLQEALRNQIDDLQRALGDGYAWVGAGRNADGSGELNPIFYHRGAGLVLHGSGTFWLSDTPGQPGTRFGGSALPRICTWAALQREGQKLFYFVNTHFDYQSSAVQDRSAALLLSMIPTIAGLYPSVLVGDLNCHPGSAAHRRLASRASFYRDTSEVAESLPADRRLNAGAGTFTGFRDSGMAARVLPDEETIDYAFVSGFALQRREICLEVRPDGRCISDHRALFIEASISV